MASSALVFFFPPVDRHELQTSFCYAHSYPKLVTTALVIGSVFLGTSGCGSDPVAPGPDPDFMVGDWLAQSQLATSVTDPQVVTDLTALGAVFTLLVQPSGRYTAISEGFGPPRSEFGELTVDGLNVVFTPQFGEESLALWERVDESVILVSEIDFDFDLDGTTEATTLRRVLIPK